MRPTSDETSRFLAKVIRVESGCHEWRSGLDRGGYGKFTFRGVTAKAHRVSYELFVGPIHSGLSVLHRCDNRKCVNPAHLFLGTVADNIADMDAKGRRGSRSKLRISDVIAIKEMLATLSPQEAIAEKFGVSQTAVSRVNLGKTTFFKEP